MVNHFINNFFFILFTSSFFNTFSTQCNIITLRLNKNKTIIWHPNKNEKLNLKLEIERSYSLITSISQEDNLTLINEDSNIYSLPGNFFIDSNQNPIYFNFTFKYKYDENVFSLPYSSSNQNY